jgi:hypothetical protein
MSKQNSDHISDVIIYTSDQLSDRQFADLSKQVYHQNGVVSMNRNLHAPRFLMVVYNAASVQARSILETVRAAGYHATLVGM